MQMTALWESVQLKAIRKAINFFQGVNDSQKYRLVYHINRRTRRRRQTNRFTLLLSKQRQQAVHSRVTDANVYDHAWKHTLLVEPFPIDLSLFKWTDKCFTTKWLHGGGNAFKLVSGSFVNSIEGCAVMRSCRRQER